MHQFEKDLIDLEAKADALGQLWILNHVLKRDNSQVTESLRENDQKRRKAEKKLRVRRKQEANPNSIYYRGTNYA